MKSLFSIFIALLLLGCSASPEKSTYEAPDITGYWKLMSADIVNYIPSLDLRPLIDPLAAIREAYTYEYATNTDLVFTADSIFRIDYPMELIGSASYNIDTAYLNFGNRSWPIYVNADTLLLYRTGDQNCYLEQVYYRTHFEDSIVSVIKKDKINYGDLAGTWFLVRAYDFDYGCEYILDFPHDLPDSIVLTREEILVNSAQQNRLVEMMTDGIKRKYTLGYYRGTFFLKPGSWYEGADESLQFSRYHNEN
jgi:hypothetical protein